jgi:cystathionine beta-lyase/cystathionine gamma-synthase
MLGKKEGRRGITKLGESRRARGQIKDREASERWRFSNRITPHVDPIFQVSVFDYPDLESFDDYYTGKILGGYLYSRNGLPNSDAISREVALLEGMEAGIACSSGMSALMIATLANLGKGDSIVASSDLYGGTTIFLREELKRFGISTFFDDASNLDRFERIVGKKKKQRPKMLVVETISNPTMKVCDLKEISKIAQEAEAWLLVDNTMATPYVARPRDFGADIVVHSGTKFLGGHHDITLGLVCSNRIRLKRMSEFLTRAGPIAAPFDCWLAQRSLTTWKVRMEKSCENAMKLAEYLEGRDDVVSRVYYPGLASHPTHDIARRIFKEDMYGAMLSFDIRGGLQSANSFVKALSHVRLTPSLGGVRTTISHPGKTSHRNISQAERQISGISDSMIRVSVGVEDYEKLEEDFDRALNKAKRSSS